MLVPFTRHRRIGHRSCLRTRAAAWSNSRRIGTAAMAVSGTESRHTVVKAAAESSHRRRTENTAVKDILCTENSEAEVAIADNRRIVTAVGVARSHRFATAVVGVAAEDIQSCCFCTGTAVTGAAGTANQTTHQSHQALEVLLSQSPWRQASYRRLQSHPR